jgi:hypothetical protein
MFSFQGGFMLTANEKRLAEVWVFEKLQFSLCLLLIKENRLRIFSKAHVV